MDEINYTNEEWRSVVGYEGIYSVSNLGRVRRDKPYRSTKAGRILPLYLARNYHLAQLCNRTIRKHTVHTLVAAAFIGPRPSGMQINHRDGNKTNNCLSNLEYVTPLENLNHAKRTGLMDTRGARNGRAKLSEDDVRTIRRTHVLRDSQFNAYALARRFRVTKHAIDLILNRTNWKHVD